MAFSNNSVVLTLLSKTVVLKGSTDILLRLLEPSLLPYKFLTNSGLKVFLLPSILSIAYLQSTSLPFGNNFSRKFQITSLFGSLDVNAFLG
ncbi:hypothetical protein ACFX2A_004407 [Malus domestica]